LNIDVTLFQKPGSASKRLIFGPVLLLLLVVAVPAAAQKPKPPSNPIAAIDADRAAAEHALQAGERQIAESRYRDALYNAWMVRAALAVSTGHLAAARDAFTHASEVVVDNRAAQQSLAIIDLQLNDPAAALSILYELVDVSPGDAGIRRLLAQALVLNRKPEEAVQVLEETHRLAPDDIETTFALATGYLRVKKVEAAEQLFNQLTKARPIPQTYVLIGRAYRDAAQYQLARAALDKALAMDPHVRHAHFYLGTIPVMAEGVVRVEEAITEFRRELELSANDPLVNLRLGMALVEAHREKEAIGPLQIAAAAPDAGWQAHQYLGRCQLALGKPDEAVVALRKALDLSANLPVQAQIGNLHYQLAMALRATGDTKGADAEFAAAATTAEHRTESGRDALDRFMQDTADAPGTDAAAMLPLDPGGFGKLSAEARSELDRRVASTLAGVYLNLGVMQAQAEHFARAAELFESAAAIDAAFPQVQYSLGVAYFNAQQYDKAAAALTRALAADPSNVNARRMLALASLNTDDFAKAAELLRDDPQRDADPSMQFAYGVALVRSGHAAEAEATFSRLVAAHSDSAELNVVLGQAHAEQGDYDGAVASLQRALTLKPDVAEANAALGLIYLKQGRLADATQALKAELANHPDNVKARYNLATVLDLDGHRDEATSELRTVLKARPAYADARYLFGKILLTAGSADAAVEQLEIAQRLAPDDANIHYQLAQAYQKTGRAEQAQQQFELFQKLKDKRRGGSDK
jgi:tetratricopeptide (TPR) repeat protein